MNHTLSVFIATLESKFFPRGTSFWVDEASEESDFDKFFVRVDFFDDFFTEIFERIAADKDFSN